jgi:integrase
MTKRRTRGDGGLIQRHDAPTCPPLIDGHRPDHTCQGRWVGTLSVKLPSGEKKRKSIYGRTQATVRKALAKAVRERDAGTLLVTSTTVEQWLTYWLENIAARTLKPRTLAGYRGYINTHLIPRLGRHRLDGLRPEHIRALHDQMRADDKAPATILQAHAILAKALNDAVNDGKIALNPCDRVARPKAPKNHRRGLSVEQASLLLRATDDLRWWLAVFYGMRQGEVLGLRWGDIDLDAQVIRVEQTLVNLGKSGGLVFGTPKSATSRRTIPLTPMAEARVRLALAHIDGEPDPAALVFAREDGRPVHPATDLRAWHELLDAHNLPSVTLHAARNTAANLMEAEGMSDRMVAQILGHASVQITHGYQHAEVERMRAGLNGMERRIGAPKELGD